MSPDKLVELETDARIEALLSTDYNFFLDYYSNLLDEANSYINQFQSTASSHGWNLTTDEIHQLLKEY